MVVLIRPPKRTDHKENTMTDDTMLLAALEALRVELAKTNHTLGEMVRAMPAPKQWGRIAVALEDIATKLPSP